MDKIEKLIRNFIWSQNEHSKGFPLISCNQTAKAKEEGDLGIYSFRNVQKAMLGKLLFRLANDKEDTWVQWILSSYNLKEDFWNYNRPPKCSPLL